MNNMSESTISELKVSIGQYTDHGRKKSNQDFIGRRIPKASLLNIKGIALAIADGISSSEDSHIASEVAVKTFLQDYYCTSESWSTKRAIEQVLKSINSWLYSQSQRGVGRFDKDKGHVCTFSSLVIKNNNAHIFHIGDSRVYHLTTQGMEQVTHDHRIVGNEGGSYLSRALGINQDCEFDYHKLNLSLGDYCILCTDGIYEFVPSQQVIGLIHQYDNQLDLAAEKIVQVALDNGSDDNLSIQIVKIESLPNKFKPQVIESKQLSFPPQLSARMEFEGYTILTRLHHSSRSQVYLALDNEQDKKVVIKVPGSDLTIHSDESDALLDSFLMEEWVARRINSGHVIKAEPAKRGRQTVYTVFEYIEGQTLAQWAIDNPKPSLETVRKIVEQVAKGLHALHKMDILHQDIRPENIMLDQQGLIKILDLGSVSIAGLEETQTGQVLSYLKGTALYSAPEYFLGEQGSIRSEIFSLGVLTYFLMTGQYPYGLQVAKTKTLSAQRKLRYQSLLDEQRSIPLWFDETIRKAVEPLANRRYDELFEFIHDLRKPNQAFLNKAKPPLMERNPVLVWQAISFGLAWVIVYLLSQGSF